MYYRRNFLSTSYGSLGRGLHTMGKLLKVGSSLSSIETKEPRERKSVGWATREVVALPSTSPNHQQREL